jgi:hypothetical protein
MIYISNKKLLSYKDFGYQRVDINFISQFQTKVLLYNEHYQELHHPISETFEFYYILEDELYSYHNISYSFISHDFPEIIWNDVSKYQKLSEDFIREFQNEVNWAHISRFQILSEDFIEEFQDKVNWNVICRYQKMSDDFINNFKNLVDWLQIFKYQNVGTSVIYSFINQSSEISSEYDQLKSSGRTKALDFDDNYLIYNISKYNSILVSFQKYILDSNDGEVDNILSYLLSNRHHKHVDHYTDDTLIGIRFSELTSNTIISQPNPIPAEATDSPYLGEFNYLKLSEDLNNRDVAKLLYSYQLTIQNETNAIIKSYSKLAWTLISQYQMLSYDDIRLYQNNLNWNKISKHQRLFSNDNIIQSTQFTYEFKTYIDWFVVCKYQVLSENFIEEFKDYIDWKNVSRYQRLSESFIELHQNDIDWYWINEHQRSISIEFYNNFSHRLL